MNRILLDTNIILDIALKRADFFEKSKEVLILINEFRFPVFITATTITDIYYILKKSKGHGSTISFIKGLIEYIDVCGVNKETILNALNSEFNDFEDAVQSFSAIHYGIKIIITRNISDFQTSDLQVLTPGEFLKQYKK